MMDRQRSATLTLACLIAVCAIVTHCRHASAHPIVSGFERFYSGEDVDLANGGKLLIGELNCTSCHRDGRTSATVVPPKQAPVLDGVSGRVKPDFLLKFIADPHGVKPGTTMPDLFAGKPAPDKKRQVEAIVNYLLSLGPGEPPQEFPTLGAGLIGERLFHEVGCVACHNARTEGSPSLPTSVPLPDLMAKYTLPSLTDFLREPHAVRPGGRMPDLNLSSTEARSIASYLLKGLPEVAIVKYSYYEGSWDAVPDFTKLEPKTTGGTDRVDETLKERGDFFGLRFEGFLRIDKEGEYTFHLGSDDGSRLTVNETVVVNNDGVHPYSQKSGKIRLTTGLQAVSVDFFEHGGEERLTAEFEGPDVERQSIAIAMTASKAVPEKESLRLVLKPELVEEGRRLFANVGCASCHELEENGKPVESQFAARELAALKSEGGCVGDSPILSLPNYHLNARQRDALSAALESRSDPTPETKSQNDAIRQTLLAFNCYACHDRDDIGGVEEQRNDFFRTPVPEMGDEGRIPPTLTGVGAKLTDEWLKGILANGANDRPYMLTRMPKFGAENVGHLQQLLVKADSVESLPNVTFDEPLNKVKIDGRHMVGAQGFACIKCHTFGRFQAEGIQSIDLRTMTQRLREDWFRRYVGNPQAYRPGTRMPSAWPTKGKSLLRDILDGDSEKQIAAVWAYLDDGPRAKIPAGLVQASLELIPIDEAIIYRNFIEGAGPRAIGVGYPEGINLAFDANNMRIALLWQGRFIDASRHWSGRGQGFQPPAGENVIKLPDIVKFATLEDSTAAWPNQAAKELGYRFRGYRLVDEQRPVMLYSYHSIDVEDFVDTTGQTADVPLQRTLTLKSEQPVSNLYMLVASGGKIEQRGDDWYEVDGRWNVRVLADGSDPPTIRSNNNRMELLLPVKFTNGQAQIVEQIDW